jgi:transcriptional regulator GlxA family with amidase domain
VPDLQVATGFTVIEYLNYVRIRETKTLLTETDWPITRVAEKTGFDSIAHFGRVFKGITGRAPLQYRKQHRE